MTSSAPSFKEKGNAAFKASDFPTAIGHYTSAILADPKDPVYPLNRAAAYLKLGKNEDAERDCTKVLELQPKNAKAHFRRAQARRGLGKFEDAKTDLKATLAMEPANDSVKGELDLIDGLVAAQAKVKSARKPITVEAPHPQRRRVPITIIDPDSSLTSASKSIEAVPDSGLGLKAVSSRPLMARQFSSPPSAPEVIPTPPQTSPKALEQNKPTRSKVGGGIFRASGQHTLFHQKTNDGPPPTLFALQRAWEACDSNDDRWQLWKTIPPSTLPSLLKTSLEPAFLASILHVFGSREGNGDEIREYLGSLTGVPRFQTVLLFLSKEEKDQARDLLERIGTKLEGVWKGLS